MNNRSILIGSVATVRGRLKVRDSGQLMVEVCDELDDVARECFAPAPFRTLSIILRYTDALATSVKVGGLIKRHSELQVTVDVPMPYVRTLDRSELRALYRQCALDAIRAAAVAYRLPCADPADIAGAPK